MTGTVDGAVSKSPAVANSGVRSGVFVGFDEDREVSSKIIELMRDLGEAAKEPESRGDFRSSGFPYCPIIDLEARVTGEAAFVESYKSGFYTGIGTAVHENLQLWIPLLEKWKKYLWGDWACRGCGVRDPDGAWIPSVRASLQPDECSCGKRDGWQYIEVGFERGEPNYSGKLRMKREGIGPEDLGADEKIKVGGHIDLVFRFGSKFWIVDAKTTGRSKIEDHGWRLNFPSLSNVAQISNYCILLPEKFGVKVGGWILLYLSRDAVSDWPKREPLVRVVSHRWMKSDYKKWNRRLVRAAKGRKYVENLLETGEVRWANAVVASRPCRVVGEYDGWMKAKWYGKKDCPHYASGKCCLPEKFGDGMVDRVEFLASTIQRRSKAS